MSSNYIKIFLKSIADATVFTKFRELAQGDWEDLRAQGLKPTLEDFVRLNLLALRLTDGTETTTANCPRVGWTGDISLFETTVQTFG